MNEDDIEKWVGVDYIQLMASTMDIPFETVKVAFAQISQASAGLHGALEEIKVNVMDDKEYAFESEMLEAYMLLPGYDVFVKCPNYSDPMCDKDDIHDTIIHLNDHHKWSREKIADWLDTLEEEGLDLSFKEKDDE